MKTEQYETIMQPAMAMAKRDHDGIWAYFFSREENKFVSVAEGIAETEARKIIKDLIKRFGIDPGSLGDEDSFGAV